MKPKTLKISALVLAIIVILGTLSACDCRTVGSAITQSENGDKGDKATSSQKVELDDGGRPISPTTNDSATPGTTDAS